jgi:hypothetical protein
VNPETGGPVSRKPLMFMLFPVVHCSGGTSLATQHHVVQQRGTSGGRRQVPHHGGWTGWIHD